MAAYKGAGKGGMPGAAGGMPCGLGNANSHQCFAVFEIEKIRPAGLPTSCSFFHSVVCKQSSLELAVTSDDAMTLCSDSTGQEECQRCQHPPVKSILKSVTWKLLTLLEAWAINGDPLTVGSPKDRD